MMALAENANHELAVTLSLTYKRTTRVSRIFQPSKRSGSVRKPSFSVYYFVSLSMPIFLPRGLELTGGEGHSENLLELRPPTPR